MRTFAGQLGPRSKVNKRARTSAALLVQGSEVNRSACSCKCSCVLLPQRSISLRLAYVQFLTKRSDSDYSISSMAQKRTHHFRGLSQYSEQLMDLAEGGRVFEGRGQQPRNKDVLKQIAAIKACKKGSFFGKDKPCTCGWHDRAAARKEARQKAASGKYKNIFINK